MTRVTESDCIDPVARAAELGCDPPAPLALLPQNFTTAATRQELCYDPEAMEVRSALRDIGVNIALLETHGSVPPVFEGATSGPTRLAIYFSADLLEHDLRMVGLVLGTVGCTLTQRLNERPDARIVRLETVVQRRDRSGCTSVNYEGDSCEVVSLAARVRAAWLAPRVATAC